MLIARVIWDSSSQTTSRVEMIEFLGDSIDSVIRLERFIG
jgi:hypothetical protein